MLYIFDKAISNSKSILYSLTFLYGINQYQSKKICKNIGINPKTKINQLKKNQINRLIIYINKNIKIKKILKKINKEQINNLLNIKINKAIRTSLGLPVHGQRTHTNAKTSKKLKHFF